VEGPPSDRQVQKVTGDQVWTDNSFKVAAVLMQQQHLKWVTQVVVVELVIPDAM
jgi:hypothetical protein